MCRTVWGYFNEYGDILRLIVENKNGLVELFKATEQTKLNVPCYSFFGLNITKSIDIPSSLDQLVKNYSRDNSLSQKEIIFVALIEFLKKYGYASEVRTVLHV